MVKLSQIEKFKYYLVLLCNMETVSIKLEDEFAHDLDKIMKKYKYTTKTEFIREAIRDKIKDLEKEAALQRAIKIYGKSRIKTTDKQLHKAREKAFEEIEKEFR